MSGIRFDHGDVDRWALTLDRVVSEVPDEAAKVVEKGAVNIKKGAQRRIRGHPHAKHYPRTITYDMRRALRGPEAEIGPDKSKGGQANLGHIFEYGIPSTPPIPHIAPSADEELPKFEQAMGDLSTRLLEE